MTVFISELAQGTATDANGFYLVNIPPRFLQLQVLLPRHEGDRGQHAGIRKRLP
ncbi:MAG: carboxypeptidase-like regulatory domain-containing protein [Marinilabiliales bacterium]|nr:carboxypeptidase-like regulatory domain-containing protein [Marinilabiliales bacterium]